MEELDVFAYIKSQVNVLSKAQQPIAAYILANPEEVLTSSISEIAESAHSTVSSVSRFCRAVGFNGFQDFRVAVAISLEHIKYVDGKRYHISSVAEMSRKLQNENIDAINSTLNLIDQEAFARSVQMLLEANQILFFGIGSSLTVAQEGYNKFQRISGKARLAFDINAQYTAAAFMTEADVAILVSSSGATFDMIEIAKVIKKTGGKIILISQYAKSPISKYADTILLWVSNGRVMHGNDFSIELAPYVVMDMLLNQYYEDNSEACNVNLSKTAKSVLSKQF